MLLPSQPAAQARRVRHKSHHPIAATRSLGGELCTQRQMLQAVSQPAGSYTFVVQTAGNSRLLKDSYCPEPQAALHRWPCGQVYRQSGWSGLFYTEQASIINPEFRPRLWWRDEQTELKHLVIARWPREGHRLPQLTSEDWVMRIGLFDDQESWTLRFLFLLHSISDYLCISRIDR